MQTPICDFVKNYIEKNPMRLHMPGHKGVSYLGAEPFDITEIDGADSLYEAGGIIAESEKNASELFGCDTFYSTEGSSQCIRAMLFLAVQNAKRQGKKPLVLAGRNAHKTFLSAAALCDIDVRWLLPENQESYLSCKIDAPTLDRALSRRNVTAVYLTSPDYLGNILDIKELSEVCKKYDALLLVDNAHGAYLKFTTPSQHPIDLGADLCCDSAHKTLPVLTGGAYLHVSKTAPEWMRDSAKNALALFGSTSPSYLILQSLDMANRYLADGYHEKLSAFSDRVKALKTKLMLKDYILRGNEPLKLTIKTKPYGYTGEAFAKLLLEKGIHRVEIIPAKKDGKMLINLINLVDAEDGLAGYDEIVPLQNLMIAVKCDHGPESVMLQPDGICPSYSYDGQYLHVTVEHLAIHSIIVIE